MSVRDMQNDLILPVSQGGFHGDINENEIVCTGVKSLRNYTPKHIQETAIISHVDMKLLSVPS